MKNKQLKKWALLAEILGGIAVIVTLAFLVLETRNNTNAIQAQTFQVLNSELIESRKMGIDPEFGELRFKWRQGGLDALSDIEQIRMISSIQAAWGVYESAYYARERAILGDEEWARFDSAICRNRQRDENIWRSDLTIILTPAIVDYVTESCKDGL